MITEVHQEGRFYRLSTGRPAHYENIKPHNPSTEDWCIRRGRLAGSRTDSGSQELGTRSSVHDADSSEGRDETKKEIQPLR